MGRTVSRNITGMAELSQVLQGLPKEMQTEILGTAVDIAAQPIVDAAKRNARRSVRTGALYASIDKKVKKYPSASTAVAIVGPSKGYFGHGGRKLGKDEDRRGSESPSRYASNVEFGHAVRQPKKGTSTRKGTALKSATGLQWVPPRPYMRPAFVSTQGLVARKLAEGIGDGVEKVRRKLVKQGAHAA